MKTVKEVSNITGVSVRTLHHYDAIGLLKPAKVTEAGYRMYDDTALSRLQTILLFCFICSGKYTLSARFCTSLSVP